MESKCSCGDKKSVRITELKDGKVEELYLCQKCATQHMKKSAPPKPPADKSSEIGGILGLLSLLFAAAASKNKVQESSACPSCGSTPQDIAKKGRIGCPVCYQHYQDSIQAILAKCHEGKKQHVGKIPMNAVKYNEKCRLEKEAALDIEAQIKMLEQKIAEAVKVENYEVAGVLKKKIDALKSAA